MLYSVLVAHMLLTVLSVVCLSAARSCRELLLTPIVISRNAKERVLIEGSVNSLRISIAVKQASDGYTFVSHRALGGRLTVNSVHFIYILLS